MRMFSVPMGQPPHRLLPCRLWKWGNVRQRFCSGLVKVVWYSTSSLLKWHTWRTWSRERSRHNGRFGGGRHLESLPSLGLVFWTLQFGTIQVAFVVRYHSAQNWWCMCTNVWSAVLCWRDWLHCLEPSTRHRLWKLIKINQSIHHNILKPFADVPFFNS